MCVLQSYLSSIALLVQARGVTALRGSITVAPQIWFCFVSGIQGQTTLQRPCSSYVSFPAGSVWPAFVKNG